MTAPSRWLAVPIVIAALAVQPSTSVGTDVTRWESLPAAAPAISALTPRTVFAGVSGFQLVIDGTRFEAGAQVRWRGMQRPTTFVSPTRLTASISLQDVATAGTAQVTVLNPGTTGGTSNTMAVSIVNPVGTIASISPGVAPLFGADFGLIVNGSGFVPGSIVRFNGVGRTTTFLSSTRLVARILASDLDAVATVAITVFNPTPGGGVSQPVPLQIRLLTPTITRLTPGLRQFGLGDFTLHVQGTNFARTSVLRWNGQTRPTTVVSPTELSVAIPAADVASVGSAELFVATELPNTPAVLSNRATFFTATPAPTLAGMPTPLPLMRFRPAELTVAGSNFMSPVAARIRGVARATTFVSSTRIRVPVQSSDVMQAGSITLQLDNAQPSMGSASVVLEVQNPAPVVTAVSPQNVLVGSRDTTITITGSQFVPEARVYANGSPRATTPVSSTQMTAKLLVSDYATGGDLPITVVTPGPGGGTSATLRITRLHQQIIVKE